MEHNRRSSSIRQRKKSSTTEKVDQVHLCDLPDELLLKILSYLSTKDVILNVSLVSRRLNSLAKDTEAHHKVDMSGVSLSFRDSRGVLDFLEGKRHIQHVNISHIHGLSGVFRQNACPSLCFSVDPPTLLKFFKALVFQQRKTRSLRLEGNAARLFLSLTTPEVSIDHLLIGADQLTTKLWPCHVLQMQLKKLTMWNLQTYDIRIFLFVFAANLEVLRDVHLEDISQTQFLSIKNRCFSLSFAQTRIGALFLLDLLDSAVRCNQLEVIKIQAGKSTKRTKTRIVIEKGKLLMIRLHSDNVACSALVEIMKVLKRHNWLPADCTINFRHKGHLDEDDLQELRTVLPNTATLTMKRYHFFNFHCL